MGVQTHLLATTILFTAALPCVSAIEEGDLPPQLFPAGNLTILTLPTTAFTKGGGEALNAEAVTRQAKYALNSAADVVLIEGTTGEWPSLTVDERINHSRWWRSAIPKGIPGSPKLMVNVGALSIEDGKRLAQNACGPEVDADAVLVTPPIVYQPVDAAHLVEYLAAILEGCPTNVPAYFYHYPDLYHDTAIPLAELLQLAKDRLPWLRGVKVAGACWEHCDYAAFKAAEAVDPDRFALINTGDVCAPSGLVGQGSDSAADCVPGRAAFSMSFETVDFAALRSALKAGDQNKTTAMLGRINQRRGIIGKYNAPGFPGFGPTASYQITALKALEQALGMETGPSRLPLPTLNTTTRAAMVNELKAAGLLPIHAEASKAEGLGAVV